MIEVTKKCQHCDTALEFIGERGQVVVFTAHDDTFCFVVTRDRVRMLEQVILSQRDSYERAFAAFRHRVDAMLAEHGLPSLAEQANATERHARALLTLSTIPDTLHVRR